MLRPSPGRLEASTPTLRSLEALERRIAARFKTVAPAQAGFAEAVANKTARDGWTVARSLIEGGISQNDLTPQAMANLEAVISVTGRPAWFVKGDAPQTDEGDAMEAADTFWIAYIVAAQNALLDVCARVCCIMLGDSDRLAPVATGWLIGPNTIVTNAHVGALIARQNPALVTTDARRGWRLRSDTPSTADFAFEQGSNRRSRFAIKEVLYVEDEDHPDIAVFRLKASPGGPQPLSPIALDLLPRAQWAHTRMFVAGHPIKDLSDDRNVVAVFGDLNGTKRFAPGYALGLLGGETLTHDCSTTNGSSGSLHYFGKPGERNEAVSLAAIAGHPAIVNSQSGRWGD
jgi:hypothetical protein